ncbi:hypothetical protein ACHAP6_005537 [Verticillium nonalfalfae]
MRAGFEYRAEVDFHSYAEIEQQVETLFQAMSCLEEIEDRHDNDEDARIQDQAEAQAVIDDVLGKVQAVWGTGLSLQDFREMTAENLMECNKDVLRLLGTTKSLHDSDPEKLARQALENEAKLEENAFKKKKKTTTKAKSQVDRMVKRLQKAKPRQQEALKNELQALKSAKSEAIRGLEESRKNIMHITEQTARKNRSRAYMESKLAYLCTRTRNDIVQSRIQDDFRVRQKRFYGSRNIQQQASPERLVEVIAVSSLAFWRLKNDESHIPGFPREAYTGIPRAKQWLWESTAGTREEHLDTVLNNYSKLLNWIRQWSQDEDEEANIVFTKQDIDESLQTVHNNNLESLRFELSSFEDDIGRIDPLHNKENILRDCAAKVQRVIGRWHLMKPDDLTCTDAMHYMTHNAILKRDGASYTSPKSKINYAWVQSL